MPYALRKTANGYGVQNTDTGIYKSRDTTKAKAMGQMRFLYGLENNSIKKRRK